MRSVRFVSTRRCQAPVPRAGPPSSGSCVSVRDVAHRARNALALVAALFAILPPPKQDFRDFSPTQIHSGSGHVSFDAPAGVFGGPAVFRMRDVDPPFVGRAGPARERPLALVGLAGSFILVAAAAGATRRGERKQAHLTTQLAVAPSRSPPLTTAA
jgi:hypothetical protein